MPPNPDADAALLKEAAHWAMTLQYDTPTDADREAFQRWLGQSPEHAAAWARAQAVFDTFGQVPDAIGKRTLNALQQPSQARRRSLRALGLALIAAPVGVLTWRQLPWQEWRADVATATGERRTLELPDGSQLALNSASAVDIAFSATERRLRLVAGEILVTTHNAANQPPRPFVVDTPQGRVQALGTRFSVRRLNADTCRVAVFEHAVRIQTPAGPALQVSAGEEADFSIHGTTPIRRADANAELWQRGMLLARDMRLADVVAELGRHRPGLLRCHPAVAELRISGAISLDDTDSALALLARNLPVRIERRTRYWVSVQPRG